MARRRPCAVCALPDAPHRVANLAARTPVDAAVCDPCLALTLAVAATRSHTCAGLPHLQPDAPGPPRRHRQARPHPPRRAHRTHRPALTSQLLTPPEPQHAWTARHAYTRGTAKRVRQALGAEAAMPPVLLAYRHGWLVATIIVREFDALHERNNALAEAAGFASTRRPTQVRLLTDVWIGEGSDKDVPGGSLANDPRARSALVFLDADQATRTPVMEVTPYGLSDDGRVTFGRPFPQGTASGLTAKLLKGITTTPPDIPTARMLPVIVLRGHDVSIAPLGSQNARLLNTEAIVERLGVATQAVEGANRFPPIWLVPRSGRPPSCP